MAYQSPERRRGGPSSFKDDVYAVGVILYQMWVKFHASLATRLMFLSFMNFIPAFFEIEESTKRELFELLRNKVKSVECGFFHKSASPSFRNRVAEHMCTRSMQVSGLLPRS